MHAPHQHQSEPMPGGMTGRLPQEAPLAVPFVPFQHDNPPQYSPEEGLSRGTIFPGLDLPFHNIVNQTNPAHGTLLGEVMALSTALLELGLYLDTHPHDKAVIQFYEHYLEKFRDARARYVKAHGPLMKQDAIEDGQYTWLSDPWPWDYQERMV